MSELDFDASLAVAIGDDADQPGRRGTRKYTAMIPLQRAAGVTQASLTGIAVISLGGPNKGRWWDVVSVVVAAGSDDHTVVANTFVSLYATAMPTQINGAGAVPPAADLIWPGSSAGTVNSVPTRFGFSRRTMGLLSPKKLVAVVQGSGASGIANFTATLTGWDRDIDELQDWSAVPDDAYDRAER